MMTYRALRRNQYRWQDYELLPIRLQDREPIRQWRNAQLDILRQRAPLSPADQDRYFAQVVQPLFETEQPAQLLFSLLKAGELIGYGGLVHIDWDAQRAEISFLLETGRNADIPTFRQDFAAYLRMLREVAFEDLEFQKINTEAYDVRPYLTETLEAEGFVLEARLHRHVRIGEEWVDTLFHSLFRPTAQATDQPATVLVTSIGRKIPLLRAVRAALRTWHPDSRLLGADADARCLGRYVVDGFWEMPALTSLSPDVLLAYCQAQCVTAIIPTRDGELAFWARHKSVLAAAGVAVLVSSETAIAACLDKLRFAQLVTGLGFAAIPTAAHPSDLPTNAFATFVVKERLGAGSVSLGLNLSAAEAREHAATLREPIFQPFIPGREYSVDVYVNAQGRAQGAIARTRDLVVHGESQVTTTAAYPTLVKHCVGLAEQLGLYGPAVFQVLETEGGELYFIECNARFGGASTLGVACGLDVFGWFLREAAGHTLPTELVTAPTEPRTQLRIPQDQVMKAPVFPN
ncbi:ATP-grasp domain-containing protein [Hymenobacter sp. BT175]|uniref:GNAT family N-acetyltransferase n=1 Tax=Hymenobacter translucens TaxID=2886507 RepID=UPI001D0E4BEF|nr:GNAT family N-acetyltransferase [Hymenobacter translucens]MCC2545235.1 ATP-grasp domain-containing protein [Hymenobacter translucens]